VALAGVAIAALLALWWQSSSAPSTPWQSALAEPVARAPVQPPAPVLAPAPPAAPVTVLPEVLSASPPQPSAIEAELPAPAQPLSAASTSTQTVQPAPAVKAAGPRAAAAKPRKNVAKPVVSAPVATAAPVAPTAKGTVQIAISPWGQVEVDGATVGTTPPLTRLELTQGSHTITVRNEDFPPYTRKVQVEPDQPVLLKHRFGS
jgi:serine/threonine-protein kinase